MVKLAILIPTTPDRQQLLDRLLNELNRQRSECEHGAVRILINETETHKNGGPTTGAKRNQLIQQAIDEGAQYIAFHDSDDLPGETYIKRGLEVVDSGMDCGELWGRIYFSGKAGMPFKHYLGCTHAWQDDKQYHRPPNHLNFWKLDLIKDFKFQDKVFGEDMCWAMDIHNAGVTKTMYPIPEVIYNYYVGFPKHPL
jgi:hypothetical protein